MYTLTGIGVEILKAAVENHKISLIKSVQIQNDCLYL